MNHVQLELPSSKINAPRSARTSIGAQVDGYSAILASDVGSDGYISQSNYSKQRLTTRSSTSGCMSVIAKYKYPIRTGCFITFALISMFTGYLSITIIGISCYTFIAFTYIVECEKSVLLNCLFFDFEAYYKIANVGISMFAYYVAEDWFATSFQDIDIDSRVGADTDSNLNPYNYPWYVYLFGIMSVFGHMIVILAICLLDGHDFSVLHKVIFIFVCILYHVLRTIRLMIDSSNAHSLVTIFDGTVLIEWKTLAFSTAVGLIVFLLVQLFYIIKSPNKLSFTKCYVPIHVIKHSKNKRYTYSDSDDYDYQRISIMYANEREKEEPLLNDHHHYDDVIINESDIDYEIVYSDHSIQNVAKELVSVTDTIAIVDHNDRKSKSKSSSIEKNLKNVYVTVIEVHTLWYAIFKFITKNDKTALKISQFLIQWYVRWFCIIIITIHMILVMSLQYTWWPVASVQLIELLIYCICFIIAGGSINYQILKYEITTNFSFYWRVFETVFAFLRTRIYMQHTNEMEYNDEIFKYEWQSSMAWSLSFCVGITVAIAFTVVHGYVTFNKHGLSLCIGVMICYWLWSAISYLPYQDYGYTIFGREFNLRQILVFKSIDLAIWYVRQLCQTIFHPRSLMMDSVLIKWK